MPAKEILLLGNARLYEISEPIEKSELADMRSVVTDLHDTMMAFRKRYGAGRAIAAPQIGVMKRLIYMHIDEPTVFINPEFTSMSAERIDVWDDCMCFPDLLVKVERHSRCTLRFRDLDWSERQMELAGDLSELLQHEYDHLDGILAVSRAIDGLSFALRSQREVPGH
ncbi:MAG: peptide deformylase [Planctomycetota bacterium]|nr:peptide deformylase [Planctomycetota bacterium]